MPTDGSNEPRDQTTLTPAMSRLIRRILGGELMRLEEVAGSGPLGPDFALVEQTLDWLDHAPVRNGP